jgi:hypothetical protein
LACIRCDFNKPIFHGVALQYTIDGLCPFSCQVLTEN